MALQKPLDIKTHIKHKQKITASWDDGQKLLSLKLPMWIRISLRLQLYSGLRSGEIFGSDDDKHGHLKPLTPSHFNFERQDMLIYGKGGTVIFQPVDSTTLSLIKEYISRNGLRGNRPLFSYTTRHYRRKVKELAKKGGLNHYDLFSTHVLRAISITMMCYKKGRGAGQHHARHTSPITTAIYDRPTDSMRKETFKEVFGD